MDRTGYGEPYLLSVEEELGIIKEINISLNEYEQNIKKYYPMDIPFEIVISGMKNCLSMIKLYSKKEGRNNDAMYNSRIFHHIELPKNLMEKFRNMRMIRNGITHKGLEGGEIDLFLINFNEFIKGFDDFYSEKYGVPQPFRIDSLCNSISFLIENYDFKEDKKPAKILNNLLNYNEQFTEDYEKLKIKEINKLIKTLEKEIINIENDSYYYSILLYGQKISESMLILYLEKNGHVESYRKFIENSHINYRRTKNTVDYKNFMQILNYCRDADLLPMNVIEFLRTMQRYRNEGIHGAKPNYDLIKTYLDTLNYFLIWFNGFYSKSDSNKNLFKINEISLLIQSLSKNDLINDSFLKLDEKKKDLENQFEDLNKKIDLLQNKKDSALSKINAEKKLDETLHSSPSTSNRELEIHYQDLEKELDSLEKRLYETKSRQSELENEKIRKALDNLGKSLEILNKKIDELSKTAKRIEDKIDKILHTMDTKLDALQSLITNQINNAASKEEIEKLITEFTNNHVKNITSEYQNNVSKKEEYEKEKRKLIYTSLGEDAWNKLSDESKTFLVTSKVMYNDLIMIEDITDYSGVCILVSKALEVEMFNRFYTDFIKYLEGKYSENYEKYPAALIHTNRNNEKSIVFERNFYMGTVVYLLSPKKDRYKKKQQIKHDEQVLLEYCKDCIFSNKTEKEMMDALDEYSDDIENIKEKYRNPSAHRNAIQRVNAEECFKLVLDHEQLLKKMLNSFKY